VLLRKVGLVPDVLLDCHAIIDRINGIYTPGSISAESPKKPKITWDAFVQGAENDNLFYHSLLMDYLNAHAYVIEDLRTLYKSEFVICGYIIDTTSRYKTGLTKMISAILTFDEAENVEKYLHMSSYSKYDVCIGATPVCRTESTE